MDFDLDVWIKELPKISIGLDPIEIKPLTLTLNPIEIKVHPLSISLAPIEIRPIDFSLRIKEIPSVRVWLPADYKVCFALCGAELASVRLCGQAQVITEPYVANPCECGPRVWTRAALQGEAEPAEPAG